MGSVKSCGCIQNRKRHYQSRTRIYRIYAGMKQRCYNPTCRIYNKYGGRGIKIDPVWLGDNGFTNFYNWSMEHGYAANLTIDRLDPQKGYSPDNCKWATYTEQNTHLAMPKSNTSGVLGVSWSKKEQRWIATVTISNKTKRIGSFRTKEEAAMARNKYIADNELPNMKSII